MPGVTGSPAIAANRRPRRAAQRRARPAAPLRRPGTHGDRDRPAARVAR